MRYIKTKHEKKSLVITLVIHAALILLLLFFGFTYLDPPPESGIAVNFGNSNTGQGAVQPKETVKTTPQRTSSQQANTSKSAQDVNEKVVTQDNSEAPVISKKNTESKKTEIQKPKTKPQQEQITQQPIEDTKPVKKPDPKPDKSTTDALSSILNASKNEGTATQGEGDDSIAGDKGSPNGDPNARAYYGTGKGLDGDGNYRLGGRQALNKEKFLQDCNEAGIVVVKIEVNRAGKVTKAIPGVKGTTNSANCLTQPAKRAALATQFNSDNKAPSKQIGTIIYEFKLSE